MNSPASSSVSLSFGRTAFAALASTLVVAAVANAQHAQGWPSKNAAVKGPAIGSGDVVDIDCGLGHAIALLKDGTVRVRGVNSLSTGFICNMPGGCDYISIAAGYKHSIALRRSGEIVGAGVNKNGELNAPAWLTDAVSLAAGDKFSGALRADGTIALWGSPLYGKTIAPEGLDQVVKLSLGQDHGVALRANGWVRCWGRNTSGQAPAIVLDPSTGVALEATDVAAGDRHTVALRANGTVYCWGYYKNCMSPIGLANVVSVAAGPGQGVALRANGAVVAWGAPRSNPPAFNNAVQVAAGRAFGYALVDAGGIQSPAVTEASSTKASSCADASGGLSVSIEDAPIRWWTGPNGFFSTREDLSSVGFGRYTLHLRGAGGETAIEYLVDADDATTWHLDDDGDGFGSGDPASARRDCVQPVGMVSNGNDCDDDDHLVSDGEEFYADSDHDGFGDPETEIRACTPPEGYVEDDNDCNDEDVAINPDTIWYRDVDGDGVGSAADGTERQCEQPYGYRLGGNDNCPDNPDLLEPITFYYDGDHDNFGNTSQTYSACSTVPPIGYVLLPGDCNDSNAAINPGAQEVCDLANADEDCDGSADDADTGGASGKTNWYVDGDNDTYGAGNARLACDADAGEVAINGDCNDLIATINPGAQEVCDAGNVDQDCDGLADDVDTGGAFGKTNWYVDGDSDTFGAGNARPACDASVGEVANNGDCNDSNASINPGAQEACDAMNTDEDCDGAADDADTGGASGKTSWYVDGDSDSYGAGTARSACDAATGEVATNGDCNDSNASINPGAQETCDAMNTDEDCDGFADDADTGGALGKTNWYVDGDSDTYGAGSARLACDANAGEVAINGDCNDSLATINPGAQEVCDPSNTDEDCDGLADDADSSTNGGTIWYPDSDGDGYGSGAARSACDAASGEVPTNGDCNDANAAINPGAQEFCDPSNTDEDCDGLADDADSSATGKANWYVDGDSDTYGAGIARMACDPNAGEVATNGDCDDLNPAINPAAQEVCDASNTDEDCDGFADNADSSAADAGKSDFYIDADGDGYGAGAPVRFCDLPTGYAASAGDNCPQEPALQNPVRYFYDSDNDGYGNSANFFDACSTTPPIGYRAQGGDCADTNAAINPGAQEICDSGNIDQDCDGLADDADSSVTGKTDWYADTDGDGYGAGAARSACDAATGEVSSNNDCAPSNPAINPGAQEVCDSANTDEDCDDLADDADSSVTGKTDWYADTDGDGYGAGAARSACDADAGEVSSNTDCAPSNPAINPGAQEVCDSSNTDEDCDGLADDADNSATGQTNWYADTDGDGYGAGTARSACDAQAGEVSSNNDCAPSNAAISPGAQEVCDSSNTDEDCDGSADDADSSVIGKTNWYADTDGDTYGAGAARSACDAQAGEVSSSNDCAPSNPAINPGAQEVCDSSNTDEDCDGLSDNNDTSAADAGKSNFYVDGDSDTYGAGAAFRFCDLPSGYSAVSTDCNDSIAAINPGAQEVCDSANTDEDCDNLADNNDSSAADAGKSNFYVDGDSDTYGAGAAFRFCDLPSGYSAVSTDCNDSIAAINPGAEEICDSANTDEDCDNLADNNDSSAADAGKSNFYVDGDSDAYGAGAAVRFCDLPSGYSAVGTDCNDANSAINPAATEVCDQANTDENCNGQADNADSGAADAGKSNFYLDTDGDGFGAGDPVRYCDQPAGYSANAGDNCPLEPALQNPVRYYYDSDNDGYGNSASFFDACSTTPPIGYRTQGGDCVDTNAAINPGAQEVCDAMNVDEDCDTLADNADSSAADAGKSNFYVDADGDSFGAGAAVRFCDQPAGYSTVDTDCNDVVANGGASVFPGAPELCANLAVDNDCDGSTAESEATDRSTFYADGDGDGFTGSTTGQFCTAPGGYEPTDEGDCNDNNNQIYPGAPELCANLAVDNDCDGSTAESEATDRSTFYADGDGDGFTGSTTAQFCTAPGGYEPTDEGDCNDNNNQIYPGAPELCANLAVDNNCDGSTAESEATDRLTFYADADGDTFTGSTTALFCTAPAGYEATSEGDCNDSNNAIYPGAVENCENDGVDNDCDGEANSDAEAIDAGLYYLDADHDGFGFGSAEKSCTPVSGRVTDNSDCDDARVEYSDADHDGFGSDVLVPCNGVLNTEDCDDTLVTFLDTDHDGFGYGSAVACGNVTDNSDCYPDDVTYPDPDGDGFGSGDPVPCGAVTDHSDCVPNLKTYSDLDRDGFGSDTLVACGGVANSEDCDDTLVTYSDLDNDGYGAGTPKDCGVASNTDCNDDSNTTYPGALENCANDGTDNDCDGEANADAEAVDSVSYYVDGDADGFGAGAATKSCSAINGSVTNNSDCDDASVIYADGDGDGFGAGPKVACDGVSTNSDCNDADDLVYPGALENCANDGTDNDCDGEANADAEAVDSLAYYVDGDSDTFGSSVATAEKSCSEVPGSVLDNTDCNDADDLVYPGALENCANDGTDNDCDGEADADGEAVDSVSYYVDADSDGFGFGSPTKSCTPITGSVTNDSDCDPTQITYADGDGDTYGAGPMVACNGVSTNTDCNDADDSVHPGALENCANLAVDNNCDGSTADAEAVDSVSYYIDADSDGFGFGSPTKSCTPISGSVTNSSDCYPNQITYADADGDGFGAGPMVPCGTATNNTDCDDSAARNYPGATEVCADGVDNDCNGEVDEAGCIPFELTLEGDVVSIEAGTPVVVSVIANTPPKPVRGVQLVLSFDPTALELDPSAVPVIAPHPDSPLSQVVGAPLIDPVAGTIRYLLVAPTDGPSMTTGAVLCDVHFKALESRCNQAALVRFTVINGFGTQCSALDGGAVAVIVPVLTDLGVIDVDAEAPVISPVPPFGSVIPADAGALTAFVEQPVVTVTDDCDDQVQLVVTGWPSGSRFPIGSTTVTWSATDTVGNETIVERTITVGNYQLLDLTVSLEGMVLPSASPRTIRVTAQSNTTVTPVLFNGESVQLSGIVIAPASLNPGCISVKDPKHSLARSVSATVAESGVRYSAAAVLRQGDSDDNNKVDVLDYTLWEYDAAVGGFVAPDAFSNFNGDNVVNLIDRAFVVDSVWQNGDSCSSGFAAPQLVTRISVKELRRMGLGHLAGADRNHDGWVDARDIRLAEAMGYGTASGLGR